MITDEQIAAGRKAAEDLFWEDVPDEDIEAIIEAALNAVSQPPADVVERVAKAINPARWAEIEQYRETAAFYRSKTGQVGYRSENTEQKAEHYEKLATRAAEKLFTMAHAAIAALSNTLPGQGEGCPICTDLTSYTKPEAASFCDEHYRQFLATFQIYPKDLDAYRSAALTQGDR